MKRRLIMTVASVLLLSAATSAYAGIKEAKKWIDNEFQPSTLTKAEQMKEMEWFIKAAEPFKGMEINVLSETIPTHEYESKVLAKAFTEITGIKVTHQVL
ncbi:MAG: carbohydrate ABC transporter substrate-binding protein, partial [Hyphomicrobiales bacterium]